MLLACYHVLYSNYDVVHVNPLKNFRWYISSLDFGFNWVSVHFGYMTCFTFGHKIAYIRIHVVPVNALFER